MPIKFNRPKAITDTPFTRLEDHGEFIRRHIGPGDEQIDHMLGELGVGSLDALVESTLPPSIHSNEPLQLPRARNESETLARLRDMANLNIVQHSMIGMGYHDTITPPVILRNILENPGWYTAYTPYQAEISQGRLEAMLNYQQMICDLTGMELANASLLDEATAAAEAMAMLKRINRKNKSKRFLVDQRTLPQTLDVLRTRATHFGYELVVGEPKEELENGDYFGGGKQEAGGFSIPVGFLTGTYGNEFEELKWKIFDQQVKQKIFTKIGVSTSSSE